jgi:hypothetical protein
MEERKNMKGKILAMSICMLLIATALPAVGTLTTEVSTSSQQMDVEWEYTYGGDEFDWFYDCVPTQDGGYVAAGLSEEDNIYYAWIVKVDEFGIEEWSTINYEFNGTEIETDILVECVRQAPDEGYVVGGFGRYYSTVHSVWTVAGYLWKVDASGVTEWQMPIGNEMEQWYMVPSVFYNFDDTGWMCGGFYLGYISPTEFYLDVALFKTDFDGNLLWYQTYDLGYDWEWARSLDQTEPDDGYFLSGTCYDSPSGPIFNYCMIKTLSDGTLEWSKIFDSGGFDFSAVMGCCQTSDDGYIMSGITDGYGAGYTDLWIIKTDTSGDELWNITYGDVKNDRNYGMCGTTDGGFAFIVIKDAYSYTGTREDTWIIAGRTGAVESPASDGLMLKVGAFPQLNIEVSGGLGVTATVTNNGAGDALGVPWNMNITGGILGMVNKTVSGTTDISSGTSVALTSGLFFGFGPISITVTVGLKEMNKEMFHLFIWTV